MWRLYAVMFVSLSISIGCKGSNLDFPPGFLFGAASAAFQIEGGSKAADKSPSIWDTFTRDPNVTLDGSTGEVACDSYHLYEEDVKAAKALGLHFYRFSISWPRLLPSGFANHVSKDGLRYYNNLINALLREGIEPVVTLYHWDLPQRLQDLGGWTNPLITDWFAEYARVAYREFGDRVKTWLTINEAIVVCTMGYGSNIMAPGINDPVIGAYLCNKHIILAHGKAYRVYDKDFRSKQKGKVSLANQLIWMEPLNDEDEDLAETARQFAYGAYSHPIFSKEGGWPPVMEKVMSDLSKREGYPTSRLPAFTKEEIEIMRGAYDYFGFNHYTSRLVRPTQPGEPQADGPFYGASEINATFEISPKWKKTSSFWFMENPEGIRKTLSWLKKNYGDVEILITENGYSSEGYELNDYDRISYYKDYIEQVLLAIHEDGVNVIGYTAWTLLDNFEWMEGYTRKFGLYEVNFDDPKRQRTARKSAHYYASIIKAHSLDVPVLRDEL